VTRARHARLLAVVLALAAGGCGATASGTEGRAGDGDSPAGLWTLDREALLAAVRRRHGGEGGDDLAREEAQAQRLEVDLEIRRDGRYGMRTRALDVEQRCVGAWTLERGTLRFRRQIVDGKPVTTKDVEEARFSDDRITLPFDAVGLSFALVRRPGS
jgi:hypothetical protein